MRAIRLFYEIFSAFSSRKASIAVCLVALVFSAFSINFGFTFQAGSKPIVGVVYYYYEDESFTITSELQKIHSDGFQIVEVPFWWSTDPSDPNRVKTDVMFSVAQQLGLIIYVREAYGSYSVSDLNSYLAVYGNRVNYLQVVNEADAQIIRGMVPGQIATTAQQKADAAKAFNSSIQTVASFVTPLVPTLVTDISQHADVIAMDVYEQVQLDAFPLELQMLLTASNKQSIWIGEFGSATLDNQAQANFLISGLNTFQKDGINAVIIWCWKDTNSGSLNIEGRLSETAVSQWIRS